MSPENNNDISAKDIYEENGDELITEELLTECEAEDESSELMLLDGEDDSDIPSSEAEEIDTALTESSEAEASSETEMIEVVGVRFKSNGKIYYFSPAELQLENGDNVIVDTSRGQEYGTVCMPNREVKLSEVVPPVRGIVRLATPEDTEHRKRNEELEISAYNTFIERIDAHGLTMKLIDVECAFDNSKLLFYFSAENRIDFRELVRELAGIFHTRIELRQIGIRDEAKMLGGLGICGRPFCCSTFLDDFVQVFIKMAKEQNLSLNSSKISGACGRLMCCLRYEYETYLAEKAITPKVGSEVMTPDGEGIVSDANPLTGIVKVKLSGTAGDDAPTVFVREDIVLKENYNGEQLTKTPIPEKHTSVTPATFEVRSPFADDPEAGASKTFEPESTKDTASPTHSSKEHRGNQKDRANKQRLSDGKISNDGERSSDRATSDARNDNDRKNNAHNNRHKPHDRKGNRPQEHQGKQNRNATSNKKITAETKVEPKTQEQKSPKRDKKPQNQDRRDSAINPNKVAHNGAENQNGTENAVKKQFKPFHHKNNRHKNFKSGPKENKNTEQ